jgi:hypothetical protein
MGVNVQVGERHVFDGKWKMENGKRTRRQMNVATDGQWLFVICYLLPAKVGSASESVNLLPQARFFSKNAL